MTQTITARADQAAAALEKLAKIALRERARRRAIAEAQVEATNLASGHLDVAKFGTALARRGLRDEARPLLALRQQQKLLEKKILG